MSAQPHCLIIGGSHAGAQTAASLRQEGYSGAITLISNEPLLPYHRPPLSKGFLCGGKSDEELLIRPAAFYEKQSIQVRLSTTVTAVDPDQHVVHLDNGEQIQWTDLVLATGAQVRRLTVPGSDLPGVCYLRSRDDVLAIRQRLHDDARIVIIGGGYIGLETAAALRTSGHHVTVLEAQSRVLQRVTAEAISQFYTRVHREEGVVIELGAQLAAITGEDAVNGVVLADGRHLPADLVIAGIGVVPCTDLAQAMGLTVNDGIIVDAHGRTSHPDIHAAGDCTRHHHALYDRSLRLESVQNASDQARAVAQSICGKPQPYQALPWFWSDQYDLKLQIAGLSAGYDRVVVRGRTDEGRGFSAFYFQGERLLAIDAINRPKDFIIGKRLLSEGRRADPVRLADPDNELSSCFD